LVVETLKKKKNSTFFLDRVLNGVVPKKHSQSNTAIIGLYPTLIKEQKELG